MAFVVKLLRYESSIPGCFFQTKLSAVTLVVAKEKQVVYKSLVRISSDNQYKEY